VTFLLMSAVQKSGRHSIQLSCSYAMMENHLLHTGTPLKRRKAWWEIQPWSSRCICAQLEV